MIYGSYISSACWAPPLFHRHIMTSQEGTEEVVQWDFPVLQDENIFLLLSTKLSVQATESFQGL